MLGWAALIFSADFEGTATDGPITTAATGLNAGTSIGSWTVTHAGTNSILDTDEAADPPSRGAKFEQDGVNITANFAHAGTLADGITINYDAAICRVNPIPRTAMMKGIASDGTVLFVLGMHGVDRAGGDTHNQFVIYDEDFDGDSSGTNNPDYTKVGETQSLSTCVGVSAAQERD